MPYKLKPMGGSLPSYVRKAAEVHNSFVHIARFFAALPPYLCYMFSYSFSGVPGNGNRPAALLYAIPGGLSESIARINFLAEEETRAISAPEIQLKIVDAINLFKKMKKKAPKTLHYVGDEWHVGGAYFKDGEDLDKFMKVFGIRPLFYIDERELPKIDYTKRHNHEKLGYVGIAILAANEIASNGQISQMTRGMGSKNVFAGVPDLFMQIHPYFIQYLEEGGGRPAPSAKAK